MNKESIEKQIDKEAAFGILPVLKSERLYGFWDAFLVLSGYCIATWSYTQGTYLASLVGFKQLLIGAFFAAILMLLVYQLPVILSARYGIDIWIWLRAVLGEKGVKLLTVLIILVNFPWYAVCAELFASSMDNLLALAGINLPGAFHVILGLMCIAVGTLIALKGIGAITWTTRILVPLLLAVGCFVVFVGFTSVPADVILDYSPVFASDSEKTFNYILSIEANFAFVITLIGGMSEVPRLTRKEGPAYVAGVLGQGLSGSFFVVVGAVMSIAMQHVTGEMIDDPTTMLATLAAPSLALFSLLLVAFANIGTQAVGSYIYGVMLRSSFKSIKYKTFVFILAAYAGIFVVWGGMIEYFGVFLTIGAFVYSPLAAVLFADFFMVRRQKISLRDAYGMTGHDKYRFTGGFNLVGLFCIAAGIAMMFVIYNPITGKVHFEPLFALTPTGGSFIFTALLYYLLSKVPAIGAYMKKDEAR